MFVLLPLNFDVLGYASNTTTSFLDTLFRLEAHHKSHVSDYFDNELDELDHYDNRHECLQSDTDKLLSKRWREVSTLINRCTTAHIMNNAQSVRIGHAKAASNLLRFSSSSPPSIDKNSVINDSDDDNGGDKLEHNHDMSGDGDTNGGSVSIAPVTSSTSTSRGFSDDSDNEEDDRVRLTAPQGLHHNIQGWRNLSDSALSIVSRDYSIE